MTAQFLLITDMGNGTAAIAGYGSWDDVKAAAVEMTKFRGCVGYADTTGAYAAIGAGAVQIASILRGSDLSDDERTLVGTVEAGSTKTVTLV